MKKIFIVLFIALSSYAIAQQDVSRCKDSEPTYLNRMPGFYVTDCRNSDFNEVEFVYYISGKANKINKGGKYYMLIPLRTQIKLLNL